jgi:hypothetical protein
MFDLIFGLGNIICVLAVCGLPIGLINPVFLKQKTRTDVFKLLGSLFLAGFVMVAVGQYYGNPQL